MVEIGVLTILSHIMKIFSAHGSNYDWSAACLWESQSGHGMCLFGPDCGVQVFGRQAPFFHEGASHSIDPVSKYWPAASLLQIVA